MERSTLPPLPRTVILDYYDSYTNNLLTLLTQLYSDKAVLRKVVVIKADHFTWEQFQRDVLPNIDCVILSPGPGRPDNPSDIGFALDLLRLHRLPILGVCLGHQAIGMAFGGKIINTPRITHGHVVSITPVQPPSGLFASPVWQDATAGKEFEVVVYNSLTVDPENELAVTAWSAPLQDGKRTIQGLRHKEYPIWGVQYHPESISSTHGKDLLLSFILKVHALHSHPETFPPLRESLISSCAYRVASATLPSRPNTRPNTPHPIVQSAWPTPPISPTTSEPSSAASCSYRLAQKRFGDKGRELSTQEVFERVIRGKGKGKAVGEVWLDGQTPTRPSNTSFALPSFVLTYSLASRTFTLHRPTSTPVDYPLSDTTFWEEFSDMQDALSARLNEREKRIAKWRGGWVGWCGYEMKEESLVGYRRKDRSGEQGEIDACWAWAGSVLERTIEDSSSDGLLGWLECQGVTFTLSQNEHDSWQELVEEALSIPPGGRSEAADRFPTFHPVASGSEYRHRIDGCREAIRQGESYELTLTTRFQAQTRQDPYALWLRLRTFNPAYYSTYISFPSLCTPRGTGAHVLSSSPERFLRIDERRQVEMMPIKGTRARVKPGQCVCDPNRGCGGLKPGSEVCIREAKEVDWRIGEELRNDKKERAENLMIVDLIRSDLLSCCIPSTVQVPKLIALESYGVHNLVTTVRGTLAENVGSVEAVKRCFPPGSMTGAPKLRSVQLLDDFEQHRRRDIYSGALGYFSIDGTADLSVVIRTIVVEGENLSIGAGGAITWLSDRDGEWDEVLTKVKSVVGSLEGVE